MKPVPATRSPATPGAKNRAPWLLTLVTVLALAATAALGTWQLQRAASKEALASQIEKNNALPAVENIAQHAIESRANLKPYASTDTSPASVQALVHRRVYLRGTWLHQHTVFLDNRYMAGRPGFFVATPLQLDAGSAVVWVQRGWLPRDPQDRAKIPALAAPIGLVTVEGRLVAEVSRIYAMGSDAHAPGAAGASRIWQNLPAVDFGAQAQVLPIAILQTAAPDGQDAQDGLQRDWPQVDSGVAKHYGYAFQWFALCGLIIVLYAWFQFIAPRRRKV
jgi:surfeit locus 1 family protein